MGNCINQTWKKDGVVVKEFNREQLEFVTDVCQEVRASGPDVFDYFKGRFRDYKDEDFVEKNF